MKPSQTADAVLRLLMRDSPSAILVESLIDGRILDISDSFLRLFGYARDEVVGKTTADIELWSDPDLVAAETGTSAAERDFESFEATARTKSGETRRVQMTVSQLVVDGFSALLWQIFDITVYWQTEARFRTLIEQLPVIAYVHGLDEQQTLTYISPQLEAILGYSPVDVVGMGPEALLAQVHPDDRAGLLEAAEWLQHSSNRIPFEYRVLSKDGHWIWFQDQATIVHDPGGRPALWQGVLVDITARKAAEEALRQSEERFRALVQESSDIIVILDAEGNRKYVSPASERLLGYRPEELIGRNVEDIIHPDDADMLRQAVRACAAGAKKTPVLELRIRHRDGSWRDFESLGTNLLSEPSVAGIVFNSRDITSWKSTQAALGESEELFRGAFDNAPIGIALIAPDGRFLRVNQCLSEETGYSTDELAGMKYQNLCHPEDIVDSLPLDQRFWSGEIEFKQIETRLFHKDGRVLWVLLTGSLVRDYRSSRCAVVQILDITERRHLEMDRAIMLASEREYSRQLRQLTEMRTDLTAMVAHELRGPVAALRMMTHLLEAMDLASQDRAEMFNGMKGEIAKLDRLIDDMAQVTDAEREDFSVQLHPVSLGVLLDHAGTIARTVLGDRPFTMPKAPAGRVWCDPERIGQVLHNLLENVSKHTPPGTPVELRAQPAGRQVRIEVTDRGPGILAEDAALVFEKFGRGRESTAMQKPGAGLGLYLAREIVRAHGSELILESIRGEGLVFAFDLEIAP